MPEIDFIGASFCRFTTKNYEDVAEHLGIRVSEVYAFINDSDRRDAAIERAFYKVTGMFPIRGIRPKSQPWWDRLDFIPEPAEP